MYVIQNLATMRNNTERKKLYDILNLFFLLLGSTGCIDKKNNYGISVRYLLESYNQEIEYYVSSWTPSSGRKQFKTHYDTQSDKLKKLYDFFLTNYCRNHDLEPIILLDD